MTNEDVRQLHLNEQCEAAVRDWRESGGSFALLTPAVQRAYLAVKASGVRRSVYADGPCDCGCGEPADVSGVIPGFGGTLRIWLSRACANVPDEPEPENAA